MHPVLDVDLLIAGVNMHKLITVAIAMLLLVSCLATTNGQQAKQIKNQLKNEDVVGKWSIEYPSVKDTSGAVTNLTVGLSFEKSDSTQQVSLYYINEQGSCCDLAIISGWNKFVGRWELARNIPNTVLIRFTEFETVDLRTEIKNYTMQPEASFILSNDLNSGYFFDSNGSKFHMERQEKKKDRKL